MGIVHGIRAGRCAGGTPRTRHYKQIIYFTSLPSSSRSIIYYNGVAFFRSCNFGKVPRSDSGIGRVVFSYRNWRQNRYIINRLLLSILIYNTFRGGYREALCGEKIVCDRCALDFQLRIIQKGDKAIDDERHRFAVGSHKRIPVRIAILFAVKQVIVIVNIIAICLKIQRGGGAIVGHAADLARYRAEACQRPSKAHIPGSLCHLLCLAAVSEAERHTARRRRQRHQGHRERGRARGIRHRAIGILPHLLHIGRRLRDALAHRPRRVVDIIRTPRGHSGEQGDKQQKEAQESHDTVL